MRFWCKVSVIFFFRMDIPSTYKTNEFIPNHLIISKHKFYGIKLHIFHDLFIHYIFCNVWVFYDVWVLRQRSIDTKSIQHFNQKKSVLHEKLNGYSLNFMRENVWWNTYYIVTIITLINPWGNTNQRNGLIWTPEYMYRNNVIRCWGGVRIPYRPVTPTEGVQINGTIHSQIHCVKDCLHRGSWTSAYGIWNLWNELPDLIFPEPWRGKYSNPVTNFINFIL
jgi:hypothetical protein